MEMENVGFKRAVLKMLRDKRQMRWALEKEIEERANMAELNRLRAKMENEK